MIDPVFFRKMECKDWIWTFGRCRDSSVSRRSFLQRSGFTRLFCSLRRVLTFLRFSSSELNYHQASLHLLVCPTQSAARTLADVLFDWSKLDEEGQTAVGRYAARGTLRYDQSFLSTSLMSH